LARNKTYGSKQDLANVGKKNSARVGQLCEFPVAHRGVALPGGCEETLRVIARCGEIDLPALAESSQYPLSGPRLLGWLGVISLASWINLTREREIAPYV
jgi:hypothetical protein